MIVTTVGLLMSKHDVSWRPGRILFCHSAPSTHNFIDYFLISGLGWVDERNDSALLFVLTEWIICKTLCLPEYFKMRLCETARMRHLTEKKHTQMLQQTDISWRLLTFTSKYLEDNQILHRRKFGITANKIRQEDFLFLIVPI